MQQKKQSAKTPRFDLKLIGIVASVFIAGIFVGMQLVKSAGPESLPPEKTTAFSNTYTSEYGYSFEYPDDWNITRTIVPQGKKETRANRSTVAAGESDVEVVEITKESSVIEIVTHKKLSDKPCGHQGPVRESQKSRYRFNTAFGQEIARMNLESGKYWTAPDQPEPYPQPIFFPETFDLSESVKTSLKINEQTYQYNFCPKRSSGGHLQITYYSDEFTRENLEQKTIDFERIAVMDQIVKTMRDSKAK